MLPPPLLLLLLQAEPPIITNTMECGSCAAVALPNATVKTSVRGLLRPNRRVTVHASLPGFRDPTDMRSVTAMDSEPACGSGGMLETSWRRSIGPCTKRFTSCWRMNEAVESDLFSVAEARSE